MMVAFKFINKNELSVKQIEKSVTWSSDSEGNKTRAIWSDEENCWLWFFQKIPEPIKLPTLSEIEGGE